MELKFNKTGDERKALVRAISEITGIKEKYLGAPGFAFSVGGYTVSRDGTVDTGDAAAEDISSLLSALEAHGFVSDRQTAEGAAEWDAEGSIAGSGSDSGRLVINIPISGFTGSAMDNLDKMVAAKAWIIKKMTGADDLPIIRDEEQVYFPWFSRESTAAEVDAYSLLVAGLCETAKKKQRITATERPLTDGDNEKFKARCFLLSLGFIGKEFAGARKILLAPMSGDGSHRRVKTEPPADSIVTDGLEEAIADARLIHEIHGSGGDAGGLAEALEDAEFIHRVNMSYEEDGRDSLVRGGLCHVPATDCNYQSYLRDATDAQLVEAVAYMESHPHGNTGRIAVCRRELKKRGAAV